MIKRLLTRRQQGLEGSEHFIRLENTRRVLSLSVSRQKELQPVHRAGITSLHIDQAEDRYLLTGGNDRIISIYDVQDAQSGASAAQPTPAPTATATTRAAAAATATASAPTTVQRASHAPLVVIRPTHPGMHKNCVTSVHWYPVDTGMFLSSSFDGTVKVWDTNTVTVVESFGTFKSVNSHAMTTAHSLIAVGTEDPSVKLCDLRSGARTHILVGHSKSILDVKWSPANPHHLYSASADSRIFLWDVRRATSKLLTFDQYNGTHAQATTQTITAHNSLVTSLCLTPDGRYLCSLGMDSRLMLWHATTGRNTLVNFPSVRHTTPRAMRFAIAYDTKVPMVLVPSKKEIYIFDLFTGRALQCLRAHFTDVSCCVMRSRACELYSGSKDEEVLVWSPSIDAPPEETVQGASAIDDSW